MRRFQKFLTIIFCVIWGSPCGAAVGVIGMMMSPPATAPSGGDPTASLLPSYDDAYLNWKNAGLIPVGGISSIDAARTTTCATVSPTGVTPPASNDDAHTIQSAISSCAAASVLQLGSGTFQLDQSEYILLNKGITIKGSGSCANSSSPYCSTVVNVYNGAIADWTISSTQAGANCGVDASHASTCTEASSVFLVSPSGLYNWGWAGCNLGTTPTGCGTTLTADAAQGDTTVSVASTSNFSVGMWVLIDEDPQLTSTTNPTGGSNIQASSDFLSSSGSPATMRLANPDSSSNYSFAPNRLNAELHKISAIGSGTLTFDDPLTLAFRQSGSHDARVYWPTVQGANTANPFLSEAGIENLTITRPGNGGVGFMFCDSCFMKNVEVGGWIGGSSNVSYSARTQIEGNYFHDCYDCENNGVEYPVGINSASTETYLDNNIIVRGGKGMVGRGSNTSVVAYNYVDDTFYMNSVIGDYWVDMGLNGSHYGGTHHWLFEGNWGDNCDGDETHGNAIYHTFFRNDCTGIRTTFVDPSNGNTVNDASGIAYSQGGTSNPPAPLRAAGPMAFNYWYGFVGNALGTSGVTTSGNGWVYQGYGNKSIWRPGWVGSEWPGADSNLTTFSTAYLFRHGNYDYVNASINDWTSGYSHSLANSFYASAEPDFFTSGSCTYPWPWVTPTASNPIQANSCGGSGLPAKARYDNGTPFANP